MNVDQQQHRRIWECNIFTRSRKVYIFARPRNPNFGYFCTISQVQDILQEHIQNSNNSEDVMNYLVITLCIRLTEEESAQLCLSCQPLLKHIDKVEFLIQSHDLTDEDVSRILRSMLRSLSRIQHLYILNSPREENLRTTIRSLYDESPNSLRTLQVHNFQLSSEECNLLGWMVSNRDRDLCDLRFDKCSIPCFADLITLLAGFVKEKNPSNECKFSNCKLEDYTIPHFNDDDDDDDSGAESGYLSYRSTLVHFFERRMETTMVGRASNQQPNHDTPCNKCALSLESAVCDFLNYFGPMKEAGVQNVHKENHNENEQDDNDVDDNNNNNNNSNNNAKRDKLGPDSEWVKVFAHKAVNHRVDLLFHIFTLNPLICVRHRNVVVIEKDESGVASPKKKRKKLT